MYTNTTVATRMTESKSLVGIQNEFNPHKNDWGIHKKRLEQFFIANDIAEEATKRAILLNDLHEEAYKLLQDLCVPLEPETKTYGNIVQLMDQHFKSKHAVFAERYQFYIASQKN